MKRLPDPPEWQKKVKGESAVRHRAAGGELNSAAQAFFRLLPLPVTCINHSKRIVRFG
jgi:hypothetical protein